MNNYKILNETKKLLDQYDNYKMVNNQINSLGKKLAKQKIIGNVDPELEEKYTSLKIELQNISDDMTFSTPEVWVQYKFEAYKNEAQPILNLADFKLHCSKPGYICTKRFNFLNDYLSQQNKPNLLDKKYNDNLTLDKVLEISPIAKLSYDPVFMSQWQEYEFYKQDGRVAKWQNYISDK